MSFLTLSGWQLNELDDRIHIWHPDKDYNYSIQEWLIQNWQKYMEKDMIMIYKYYHIEMESELFYKAGHIIVSNVETAFRYILKSEEHE